MNEQLKEKDLPERNTQKRSTNGGGKVPPDQAHPGRPTAVSSGNPRLAVSFPFSKIEINEPTEALRDLAGLVQRLAEQTAVVAREAVPDQAAACELLAAEADLLARRITAA